jgi:Mrp family chromosome partitioning ATPase
MNGFWRMAIDNAAKAGNLILEIDENMLVPGQSKDLYPGKIFIRNGGQPGQAIPK